MHLSCALEMKVPANKREQIYALLAMANEKLWLGHFDLWSEENLPVFRHALLLRDGISVSSELMEDLVDIAVTECERFYPAFQFVIWGGKSAARGADRGDARDRRRSLMTELAGPLVLVGCGKMGGALLARLAAPRPRARRTPTWSSPMPALREALRERAWRGRARRAQDAADRARAARARVRGQAAGDGGACCRPTRRWRAGRRAAVDRRRHRDRPLRGRVRRSAPRSCARCPTRRPRSARASPRWSPTATSAPPQRRALLGPDGGGRRGPLDRRRGADARDHRDVGRRAGLRVPADRDASPRPASRAACRRSSPGRSRAPRSPAAARSRRAASEPVEVLRQNVTSPGGTTQAALAVLMAEDGIQPLFDRAIAAGTRRSRELA